MSTDGPDGTTSDGPDDGPDDGGADGAETSPAGAPGDGSERRRRRRRRRGGGGADAQQAQGPSTPDESTPDGQPRPPQQRPRQQQQQQRPPHEQRQPPQQQQQGPRGQQDPQRHRAQQQPQRGQPRPPQGQQGQPRGQRDQQARGQQRRDDRGRGRRDDRRRHEAPEVGGEGDLRDVDDDILRGDPYRSGAADDASGAVRSSDDGRQRAARESHAGRPTPAPGEHPRDDEEPQPAPAIAWGSEDDSAAPEIVLAPDLPVDAPADDPDPLTFPLVGGPGAQLGDDVASAVGVRFVPAGRIQWADAGDGDYTPGERVLVDSDRGPRLGWIATAPMRKATRDRGLRRVIRRANDQDLRSEREGDSDRAAALRVAKDKAAALRLPLKVFRVEKTGPKINIYYTAEDERARFDMRDFVREVGQATGLRVELRQLGVRDEAKVVGGIGSCGLTLCCTTWLPDFVPVSIKMAKDQGLVLSPTKVSGQCGRLKCCLVYEQAGYAELRKGLPKLGKRVIAPRGEGRVVEVDVLRQRVRVSYGAGDTEVLPATEVKPMFPSGNQPRAPESHDAEHDTDATDDEPDLPTS